MIQNIPIKPNNSFIWSFELSISYTDVPFDETSAICDNTLCSSHLDPTFSWNIFLDPRPLLVN